MTRPLLALLATIAIAVSPSTAQQPPAVAPQNPFKLTELEQQYVDQVLEKWEQESAKIRTFSCPFRRWVYNTHSPAHNVAFSVEEGNVSYQRPDKGSFKIEKVSQWKPAPAAPGQPPNTGPPRGEYVVVFPHPGGVNNGVIGDHWVSDGKYIYEYRPHAKELAVTPIPPEMQGEQIINGPFPFLFGAKKDDLKRRYWMGVKRENTDSNVIHLVARPKTQLDRANFKAVELQLDKRTLLPKAMQLHRPSGEREAFAFSLDNVSVNALGGRLWAALFQSPRTPWGWKRVVSNPAAAQALAPQGPARR